VIYLGDHEGHPILTFTDNLILEVVQLNAPSLNYARIIVTGLKQLGVDQEEIVEYLRRKKGIVGSLDFENLRDVVTTSPKTLRKDIQSTIS